MLLDEGCINAEVVYRVELHVAAALEACDEKGHTILETCLSVQHDGRTSSMQSCWRAEGRTIVPTPTAEPSFTTLHLTGSLVGEAIGSKGF